MSSPVDPIEVLLAMVKSLGLTAADLAELGERATMASSMPTVAEFLDTAIDACSDKSAPTYVPQFRRLVAQHGERRLSDITAHDLTVMRDSIIRSVGIAKVERAIRTGRKLRSYEPDAHGNGAGENFVRGCRFFFETAKNANVVAKNPAKDVKVPKRPPAPERPLTSAELEEVALLWCTTGNDPELDTLLFEFHRKTAARREGGLNLRLGHLDERLGALTLTEKFGKTRVMPYDIAGLRRLRSFAVGRGASADSDQVFRSLRGTQISRRRYETIYDRIDEHTTWTEPLDVGVHWMRHTTLDDVRAVAGTRVASAYAGHDDASVGTIGLYSKVTFEELAAAFEALFGPRFNE